MKHLYEPQGDTRPEPTLCPREVGYICGNAQSPEKTLKNIAAIESGFFDSPDKSWAETENQKLLIADQLAFVRNRESKEMGQAYQAGQCSLLRPNYFDELQRGAQGEALKGLGSSKGAKVRHGKKHKHIERFLSRSKRSKPQQKALTVLASTEAFQNSDALYGYTVGNDGADKDIKSRAYLMNREWSNQYKMQMVYKPRPSDAPSANVGERYTENLTSRAVRKIFESGAYVATCHDGFCTFLTLTFSPEQRDRIFSGEITMGSEVSRFLDGTKKLFKRGFDASISSETHTQQAIKECDDVTLVAGSDADFHYIWVAECPANEDGEPNPHVHILLNWQVDKAIFRAWAKRLEKIWGHGFANLERIKQPKAASAYLIKAVGYAAKGGNAEQGLVRGNRYNIARCSRAPAWEVMASFDADNMAAIIKECGYRLERWRKPILRAIHRKETKKQDAIRALNVANKQGNKSKSFKLKNYINKLSQEITDHKAEKQSRGVFARSDNTFSICFDGDGAKNKVDKFLTWAAGARNWSMVASDIEFSDIKAQADAYYADEYQRFLSKRCNWESLLSQERPPIPTDEELAILQSWNRSLQDEYNQLH